MIVSIEGQLIQVSPLKIVVEVGGLGYEVNIPLSTTEKLPAIGEKIKLHTLAIYREDAQTLYGFADVASRDFFRLLIEKVSGVGPKMALGLLSRLSLSTLEGAIAKGDVALLSKCPGIGKKTAERLIVELKDKVFATAKKINTGSFLENSNALESSTEQDAISALVCLGFKLPEADKAVRLAANRLGPMASCDALIKAALN